MSYDHDTLVAFSKTWGLLYLIGFSACVVGYAFWPKNRKRFDRAKRSILERDEGPWQK